MIVSNTSPAEKNIVPAWVQGLAYAMIGTILLWFELPVWLSEELRIERLNGWMSGRKPDWLPFVPFLILFPLCWFGFRKKRQRKSPSRIAAWLNESPRTETSLGTAWIMATIVFAVAFGMSWRMSLEFEGLPPAYHDEYSYLFQAETFVKGRWSYPSFEANPELFDQMHVLNEGTFASRYFPGTGALIAPFLMLGMPWLGHQLAQAFAAMMIFWCGRELSNTGTGLLAGLLFGLSPGLILFSNLLLAHHPTLIGLTLFLWSFLRMMRTGSTASAIVAGTGLTYAMLCRPMTAAGFALPFGIAFLWWWISGRWTVIKRTDAESEPTSLRRRNRHIIAMGLPLVLGFLVIFVQNYAITGDALKPPYQVYTDTYTPRHVYGFNNVIRGKLQLSPKVIDNYDRWAKNLTPQLAIENVQTRLVNSLRWTLGVIPLLAVGLIFLLTLRRGDRRWLLIGLSILTLHIAHIPYWFTGIMGWHYVFETAPLWLLLFAEVTRRLFTQWQASGRWAIKYCWLLFIATAVSVNLWTIAPLWPAKLDRGVVEVKFPRQKYASFRERVETLRGKRNAIVFVLPDKDDVSMDYVTNPPDLNGPVLVARIKNREQLLDAAKLFPKRVLFLFDVKQNQLTSPTDK